MYDLAVAYRIYPKVSGPAKTLPYSDNKLYQAELCLRSFKAGLGKLRTKMYVIFDNCPDSYQELFRRYFVTEDLVLMPVENVGSWGTILLQIDTLLRQNDARAVYFAEDDYLYKPKALEQMLALLQGGRDVQFVTGFDHPDYYNLNFHDFAKEMQVHGGQHWHSAASTCHTFMTTKAALQRYRAVFGASKHRVQDASQWISITKQRIFNPRYVGRAIVNHDYISRIMVKAWLFCWKQILFGPPAKLWAPVPSLCLHLDAVHPAPTFDLAQQLIEESTRIETAEEPRAIPKRG